MQPQGNTNWYNQGQQQGGGLLSQIGQQLPNLASLGAVAFAPEVSLPAMAMRGAVGGVLGSLGGNIMGAHTNPVTSALNGLEQGGQLGYLKKLQDGSLFTAGGANPDVKPILAALGNKPDKIGKSGLSDVEDTMKSMGMDATPENMQAVGKEATDYYDKVIDTALENGGPVNLSKQLQPFGFTLPDAAPKSDAQGFLMDALNRYGLNTMNQGIGYDYSNVDPKVVRQLIGDLQQDAQKIKPSYSPLTGYTDPQAQRTFRELKGYYDDLKEALYRRPEITSQFENFSPAPEDLIREGFTQNPALAATLASTVSNAGSDNPVQNILDNYSHFINMKGLGKMGVDYNSKVAPYLTKASNPENPFSKGALGPMMLGMFGNRGEAQ